MSHATMIVLAGGGLDAAIEAGESLAYQSGEVDVMRDKFVETADPESYKLPKGATVIGEPRAIEFDEDDNPILWELRVRVLQTVPKMVGGWMTVSNNPPEHPTDTVVIAVRSTEEYLSTLHARLYATDNRLGIVPGTEIEADEEDAP